MRNTRYPILLLLSLPCSCTPLFFDEDPPQTSIAVFEYFWKGIDETWPEFSTKHVNWDSMYQVYRPQVTGSTTPNQLLSIFQQMLDHLKDSHTGIFVQQSGMLTFQTYEPKVTANFFGIQWLRSHYLQDERTNGVISYAKLSPEVGYMYISGFGASLDKYKVIDEIIRDFKGVKGIVIDVRGNGGGASPKADMIASRFISQKITWGYSRYRTGRSRTAMGDLVPNELEPDGTEKFLGKVVVLTNRQTFSSAEDFVLAMRASGHVTLIGDNTRGGSGSNPVLKELPNGWAFTVSSLLRCDLSKNPITNGIVPDLPVSTTEADYILGKDTIMEAAIAEIMK